MSLSLNCFILGDDPDQIFTVKISKTENISILKDLIREKNRLSLGNIDVKNIDLWQVSFPVDDLETQLANFNLSDNPKLSPPTKKLATLFTDVADDCLHVIAKAPGSAVRQSGVDVVPELKEFKRYDKTLKTPGMTPSQGAKSTEYSKVQADVAQVIYDGRTAIKGQISTIGPPIQIFHPVFNEFITFVDDPDVQPTVDDLKHVQELMYFASEVGEEMVEGYNEGLRRRLRRILQADVHEEPNPDGSGPDGVITLQIGDARIAFMILELKRELGEGGCDPTTQAGLSMRRSWIDPTREAVRQKCCCPTFLVAGGGPWLSVLGGVFTDKFIVQRLTDMRWMGLSSTEEDSRVYHNARVLIALRKSLDKLQNFYQGLDDIPPLVANKPHPRYFPHPTSFIAKGGKLTRFRYLTSLEDHAACVTYLAEIPSETGVMGDPAKVVVKFVARYGKGAHELLASKGYAPTLRYSGPLPDTRVSSIPLGTAQSAPPGLCLRSDLMHMVVMDYVHARPNAPLDVHKQIEAILTVLHSAGYVFGDLRKQNILFGADGKVKLIDFNWCGRYDVTIRDEKLPDGLQDCIVHVLVEDEPFARYPLSMSTLEGMWAPGMEPLAQIRPQHDWMMLDKLSWE